MKVLDLFSGIGGFSLGLERAGMETVAFCEIDEYPRGIIKQTWPGVKVYEDVRNVTGEQLNADGIRVDVISGGFPCQDLSAAGLQEGISGERSGLWGEIARLVLELQPRFVIVENVANLLAGDQGRWAGRVFGDLAECGYDCQWHCLPASAVGAPHRRNRVWIVAYPQSDTMEEQEMVGPINLYRKIHGELGRVGRAERTAWTDNQPEFSGVVDGFSDWTHRAKALGNAVVPQIPEIIGRAIMETHYE